MAETVLFTLTNDILKLAGSKIFSKIQLVRGASNDLKGLEDTVKTIQTMLLDAEKKQWESEQVKLWLMRLKDVLYDAQDLLDDVATEDLRRKVTPRNKMSKAVRFLFSKSNQQAQAYKVAKRIQELWKKLDSIEKHRKFSLEEHPSEATVAIVRGRITGSFVQKEEIIGRENDERQIIAYLLDSSKESVSIVSIVGIGGLGKTTLAQLAYNDEEVKNHFHLRMWVYVSDDFDEDRIIKEVLKSTQCQGDPKMGNPQDIENKSKDHLQMHLREVLDGKKYLLVLDDLWNEDHGKWSELQCLLKGGSRESKILITTRNQSVVKATDVNSVTYLPDVLSQHQSWDLLKKTAFGDGEESLNQKLEEIGQDIVKKCGGVPLAIKTIGNLLYAKEEKDWLYFQENELSKIGELNSGILEVLKLSYNHLPARLKHCFAYCALFPKDYVFDKQTMIQLWMAQGFIESDGDAKLEEIGDDYVSYLLCRSFLEVKEVNHYTGEVKLFKMHDLMHDLALKVTGNECKMVTLNTGGIGKDTRHASFVLETPSSQEVTYLLEATNLRTFLPLRSRQSRLNLSLNKYHVVFSKDRHWRTLVLGYADFCIPPSLGSRLKNLRFLEISKNSSIKSLPNSITDLVNLQTLKLFECEHIKTLPKDLRKLVNLRYLSIITCFKLSRLPPLSELSSLRTLSLKYLDGLEFDPLSSTTQPFFPSLESLTLISCGRYRKRQSGNSQLFFPKLRSVEIIDCLDWFFVPPFPKVEYLKTDSEKMLEQQLLASPNHPSEPAVGSTSIPFSKLNHLHLHRINLKTLTLETLLQLTSNLESMELDAFKLRGISCGMQHLSSLQEDEQGTRLQFLTKFRILKILRNKSLVALPEWIQHTTTLQSLEICRCESLRSLPEWIENFSLLQKLVLSDCPNLERVPSKMRNLRHLKEVRILRCPKLEESCLTDVHIPVIVGEGMNRNE